MGDFLSSRILWYSNLVCRIFSFSHAFYYIGFHAIFFSDKTPFCFTDHKLENVGPLLVDYLGMRSL